MEATGNAGDCAGRQEGREDSSSPPQPTQHRTWVVSSLSPPSPHPRQQHAFWGASKISPRLRHLQERLVFSFKVLS